MENFHTNKSIGKSALLLTATKFINLLIGMATAMLLSRFRTLEEYGTYSQLLMAVTLFTTIFVVGLPSSINFFLVKAHDKDEQSIFLSNYYTLSTLLSFITGGVLLLISPYIAKYFSNPLIMGFTYALLILPWINIICGGIDNVFIVYNKIKMLIIYRISYSLSSLAVVIFTVLLNWDFNQFILLYVVVHAIFSFIVYIIIWHLTGTLRPKFNIDLIKRIFTFSIPLGLANVAGILKKELDKLVIGGFYDTEKLAIYTNAAREIPVTIIAASITAVLLPHIVFLLKKKDKYNAINLWGNAISLSYIYICFFVAVLFIFAPQIISILYSDKYLPGVSVFRVYSLVLLFRVTYFGMILSSTGKTKIILYGSIMSLIINIILNFIFYYLFGFIGPAIATLISILISATYLLITTSRILNISFRKIFPWKNILYITVLNTGLGVVFAITKEILYLDKNIGDILESIILGIIWFIIYFVITFKFIKVKWHVLNEGY
jgi:O-antigen/teichoic acid export membrane protein